MKIEYDREADALYLTLLDKKVKETKRLSEDILIDLGEKGEVIGIEILWVSEKIPLDSIKKVEVKV
ncbi:MAG: DUF2283 domain-containing protein [Methanosarcinales archaeon]